MITISDSENALPHEVPTDAEDAAFYQTRFQCRHIFTQGRRCGSACLRGEEFCYHHHTTRIPVYNARQRRARQSTALASGQPGPLELPMPEDRAAIGLAAGQILHAIAANTIDLRRAGMMLYALQIANCALPRQNAKALSESTLEEEPVDTVSYHPDLGVIAPQTEFKEPEEPEERPSFARRLLENMQQHQKLILAQSRIQELEARLSGYEPVTATVDLNASCPVPTTGPQRRNHSPEKRRTPAVRSRITRSPSPGPVGLSRFGRSPDPDAAHRRGAQHPSPASVAAPQPYRRTPKPATPPRRRGSLIGQVSP